MKAMSHGTPTNRRARVRLLAWLLAPFLALAPAPADAQRRVEVYRMKYRTADDLLPIVQTVLAGSGSAAVDRGTNSLVLIGEPAAVGAALDLLSMQDRKLRTIVLRYDTKRVRDLEAQGFYVRWTAEAGDFRIGNVRSPAGSGSSVDVRAQDTTRRLSEGFTGTMRVTEGERTRIETGTTVPYSTGGPFGTNTEFVTAATGFDAKARILGDGRVEVDLTPFAGRLGRGGTIETMNAATLVTVEPGETVAVGGISRSSERSRSDLLRGAGEESVRDDTVLLLRADVE